MVKTKMLYALIPAIVVLAAGAVSARTVDGSMNMDEIPSPSLAQAMDKAVEALGTNTQDFVAVSAISTKKASGGGWRFVFRNRTRDTRYVEIDGRGEVVANRMHRAAADMKSAPSLSIQKATEASQPKDGAPWTVIRSVWIEERDEWQVAFVNSQLAVTLVVDSKGNATDLEKPLKKAK